jgi:hypothetical protein
MSIIFNFYKIKYLIFIKKVLFEILMTIILILAYINNYIILQKNESISLWIKWMDR